MGARIIYLYARVQEDGLDLVEGARKLARSVYGRRFLLGIMRKDGGYANFLELRNGEVLRIAGRLAPIGSSTKRGRKEASTYVPRRKQADRFEHHRSTQRPRLESMVPASSRGLHRRTPRCVGTPEQDQDNRVSPALRNGPPQHPLRSAARSRRGRSRPHPLDGEWYP